MDEKLNLVLMLSGGAALFLCGMDALSLALQEAAGQRMERILTALTGGPLRGVLAGAGITAVLQSSSAVTVMVIGLVSAGLLSLRSALPVIFGCNIGTTATAQLLAFRLEDSRGLLLAFGAAVQFACTGKTGKNIGKALFSLGLLFEGLAAMTRALEPLTRSRAFTDWLGQVEQAPLPGLLAGLVMTLLLQSSSASIALLQSFASQSGPDGTGILSLTGALPVLLGCNIGTTVTAVLASLRGSTDAKRVAAAHAVFNLSGAVVFCAALPLFVQATEAISPVGTGPWVLARQIANAHTLFNLVCTVGWLPLTPVMETLVSRMIPTRTAKMHRNSENQK